MRKQMLRSSTMVLALLLACACAAPPVTGPGPAEEKTTEIEFLSSPGALDLPFSEAVRAGDMLYLSGQIGNLPGTTELAAGGIAGETTQALENVKTILERHGSSMSRVVKCTVFLADIGEWPAMNQVYRSYFSESPPARSALAASGLAMNARVEIECIAVIGRPTS